MAFSLRISTVFLLLTFLNTLVITAVPDREYYSMLTALRFRGYHLFANAITTTDLHYDIINGNNFTFFAPIDSALYSFDMNMSAADYTTALRLHGVPNHRLSLQDLRMLPYGSIPFNTLIPDHQIHILNHITISVEGVDIALPGLYYGTHIAVHGLESIIDFRSMINAKNLTSNLKSNYTPMSVHREAYSPSPLISVTVTSPDVSSAHTISVPVTSRYRQPEIKSEYVIHQRENHISTGNLLR